MNPIVVYICSKIASCNGCQHLLSGLDLRLTLISSHLDFDQTMRVLFLTQWFDPEPAFKGADFVQALNKAGLEVEVATAFPNYPGGKLYSGYRVRPYKRDTSYSFPLHRLLVWPSHNHSAIGRILNYLSFFLSSLIFGIITARRFDIIYVYHPPITPGLAAALFCALHKKPLVIEIQDLWPDSVASSGMVGSRIASLLGHLCQFVYRRASLVISQSDGMRQKLIDRGVPAGKIKRLYNWSTYIPEVGDSKYQAPNDIVTSFSNRINVVYGGNIGQAQSLVDVVDAFVIAAKTDPSIHLHLFGSGIERDALEHHISSTASHCATLHAAVDRRKMDRIFDNADILILHLKNDTLYDVTIPSKLQHYLSCGKPIVAGLKGEAAKILTASGAAYVCAPQDPLAMSQAVKKLTSMSPAERSVLGEMGRVFYEKTMDFDRATQFTVRQIKQAANEYNSHPSNVKAESNSK